MQSRTGNWIMAVASVIAVIGVSIVPAGLGENSPDRNLIGIGATIFSLGAVVFALGIYFKAKALKSSSGSQSLEATIPSRPIRGGCDRCQMQIPVIQCKVHQQHLCDSCLSEHYDFRTCVYAPSNRKTGTKSMAARAR